MVDFNNPLAGKNVKYKIKVLRKMDKIEEKIKALNDFFFRKDLKFETKDKKIVMEVEKPMVNFVEMFKDKFKQILDMELETKEITEPKNQEKKENKS